MQSAWCRWREAYWSIVSASPSLPLEKVRIPREIWVLIASAFVIALGFGLITPVLPQFAQSFGVGATASSIVVSAFAFFRLVFARLLRLVQHRRGFVELPLLVRAEFALAHFAVAARGEQEQGGGGDPAHQ